MIEKVNKFHPDKVADRIAAALVDLSYNKLNGDDWTTIATEKIVHPRTAVEVLIGHGVCYILSETSVKLKDGEVAEIVKRIAGPGIKIKYVEQPQDPILAKNQENNMRCGDNGIFKGVPITDEQYKISEIAKKLEESCKSDGKYILTDEELIICQSNIHTDTLKMLIPPVRKVVKVNPLGDWKGGINVDCGATNRKLGSDMGHSVTGGGLHGKDFSKADVSVNIFCHVMAQREKVTIEAFCAIGDEMVNTTLGKKMYSYIVRIAMDYIKRRGGFERFAENGLY